VAVTVRVKRRQNNPTCLIQINVNGLQKNQRTHFWETLKIFKFGGQFGRTTNLKSQVFMSLTLRKFVK
jgi:hypothetical protein